MVGGRPLDVIAVNLKFDESTQVDPASGQETGNRRGGLLYAILTRRKLRMVEESGPDLLPLSR